MLEISSHIQTAIVAMEPILAKYNFFFTLVVITQCCSYLKPPAPDEEVKLHFISLVHKDGHLYELGESLDPTVYVHWVF